MESRTLVGQAYVLLLKRHVKVFARRFGFRFKMVYAKAEEWISTCQTELGFVNHSMAASDSGTHCSDTGCPYETVRQQKRGIECAFC